MKKQVLLLVALWASLSMASVRTPEEAARIAGRFAATKGQPISARMAGARKANATAVPMALAYTQNMADGEVPALYVFNSDNEGGYVIVSAEDNARTILGYSDHGTFDQAKMPANMQFWLKVYADEIARATNMTSVAEEDSTTYPEVAPLLGDIQYGQDAPYNDSCPKPNGYNCATGCVATAIAQIMRYYKYPTKGTGSNSYVYQLYVGTELWTDTLRADFGNTTYDWENMLPKYAGKTYTAVQSAAVAQLMYHIGVSCNMQYNSSSAASGTTAAVAMQKYFGYDAGMESLRKDYMAEKDLLSRISAELKAQRPMLTCGYTIAGEGHAFVIDGMKSNGYVHVNWGWDGDYDDYFAISALRPMGQGTGGAESGYAFTEGVTVMVGIQPNKGGTGIPQVTSDSVYLYSAPRVKKGQKITFGVTNLTNAGLSDISSAMCVMSVYKGDSVVDRIPEWVFDLGVGYYYSGVVGINENFLDIDEGVYEVAAGITVGVDDTYYPILCKNVGGERRFPLTVTADSVIIGSASENPKTALVNTENGYRITALYHTIRIDADKAQYMSITDAMGRLLVAEDQTTNLRLESVPNGVYMVRCGDKIQKVLVQE